MGDTLARIVPNRVEIAPNLALKREKIASVACGFIHTVVLSTNGSVYNTGGGDQGQLGLGDRQDRFSFHKVERLSGKIVAIACGYSHTALLTEGGELLTCGNGIHGQLGHSTEKDQLTPKLVEALSGKKLTKVSCGSFHTIVMSSDWEVFSFGRGSMGRLGHGDSDDQLIPKQIDSLVGLQVADVSCGQCHSIALTVQGKLYSWGCAERGRVNASFLLSP